MILFYNLPFPFCNYLSIIACGHHMFLHEQFSLAFSSEFQGLGPIFLGPLYSKSEMYVDGRTILDASLSRYVSM